MRGFALFWSLTLASAIIGWVGALASFQAHADDAQVAMAALVQKRLIGADVKATLKSALADAQGTHAAEKVADAARRLSGAESFLESAYARQGIEMDVFFGFLSDAEQDDWLDRMAKSGRLEKCPRCLDLGARGRPEPDAGQAPGFAEAKGANPAGHGNGGTERALPAVASVLDGSNEDGAVRVSKNGLHRGLMPFSTFGRPVLGAVYRFGPVIGVEVLP